MSLPGYTIVRRLGVGALSEALLVRSDDGHHAVIKRLHRHLVHDANCVAMFAHEARVLATLTHVGVAKAVPLRGLDPVREFAQEFVPGVALDEVMVALRGAMPFEAACEVLAQLLDVLDYVHRVSAPEGPPLRLVHRDVCPANVLVSRDGKVSLVDFGIATSVWGSDPDRGRLKGTRGYMAPEVITGEHEADGRADLFAAGVIFYELTVGRRLYEGPASTVMAAIVEGPIPSPRRSVPDYPPRLDAWLLRALARNVEERYTDASEMRVALDEAAVAHGIVRDRAALAAVIARCTTTRNGTAESAGP